MISFISSPGKFLFTYSGREQIAVVWEGSKVRDHRGYEKTLRGDNPSLSLLVSGCIHMPKLIKLQFTVCHLSVKKGVQKDRSLHFNLDFYEIPFHFSL